MSIQYTADQLQRKFRGAAGSPVFSRLAEVLRQEGRLDEAIQTCQEGLRARPDTLSGLVVLGKAFLDAGRMEESREQFESALRLDPRCLSAMHHLARIMAKMQWTDAAAGYYRSILEVEPWDAEIRALLNGASQDPSSPTAPPAAAATVFQEPAVPAGSAVPAEEDTYHKPDGFAGDVMEVNLNDMAADFLPGQDDTSLALAEESLEDALSAAREPLADSSRFDARPGPVAEPRPMDVLKDEPVADSSMEGEAPPISGQDVEDRLDSLFGVEDPPSRSMRDATATWSPAPPEAPGPEIAPAPDFSISDPASVATAIGGLRDFETDGMRLPVESDGAAESAEDPRPLEPPAVAGLSGMPGSAEAPGATEAAEIPGVQDFSAVDFETPLERRAPAGTGAFADQDAPVPEDRVHGEDIERRLDELFNLTEEDSRPPAESTALPVAPGPKMDEAVSLGEVVPFGGEASFEEPKAATAVAAIADDEVSVTGQDVSDKLDNLFGLEPAGDVDAQAGDGPRVTGADVEAQLDKLFQLDEAGETLPRATASPSPFADSPANRTRQAENPMPGDETDRTVLMPAMGGTPFAPSSPSASKDTNSIKESVADWLSRRGDDADARAEKDHGPAAEGTRFPDPAEQDFGAGDTLILPAGDLLTRDFDAAPEGAFDTLAPEDSALLSETTSIEMVDGEDVAGRLDELFAEDAPSGGLSSGTIRGTALPGGESSLFPPETDESPEVAEMAGMDVLQPVSGEDVSSRLEQLFEAGDPPAAGDAGQPGTGVAVGSETDEDMVPLSGFAKAGGPDGSGTPVAPQLAPMSDEEDPYPDEDELAAQAGAGANVATVTLAEIYFQQGLREQALQIYRQLLEREPENDSVRKRIEEIEATKPEGGEPGSGSDPRRPRPGLKVPKRKK